MNAFRPTAMVRLILLGFACSASLVLAQSSGTTTTTTATTSTATTATPATASTPSSKLVGSFTALAGSTENASALVNGLRTGSAITLTEPKAQTGSATTATTSAGTTSTTAAATSITFSPGTKPMGYGNIRIALSLARAQLASQGITNPTPAQLQGVLVGTGGATGTASQGILQMRASGMGWGQIANSMGFKLGAVMSGKQSFPTTPATGGNVAAGTSAKTATQRSGTSVVTGLGSGGTASSVHGKSGVTTAAGGVGGGNSHVTTGLGGGAAAAGGAVNAAGSRTGAGAGAGNGAGQGRGKP